ncbi:hypothetical protein ACGF3J_35360 [Streptomyces sp. NPDC048171]|uniref:hypothetical protein n=1 Tax=Streptomyces sp. NPDC048171 TaxID=3365504 RepID=UPI0037148765
MPFTVTGAFDDGATYSVQVTGRADRPAIGSHRATATAERWDGRWMITEVNTQGGSGWTWKGWSAL